MKKLHLILLSLLTVSLITYCPASSSGNPPPVDNTMRPPVDNMMPPPVDNTMRPPVDNTMRPPADVNTVKTIHAHVNDDVDNAEVVALSDSITVTEPTYSILEGNDANIFSINSSTGVITLVDASKVTYDAADKTNNIHLLKVRVRNGTDTTKATEAPLRIVVRGFGGAFITTWTTTETDETITIPTESDSGNSVYSYTVHWGDSPQSDTTTYTGDATHTYAAAGTYTVRITGTFSRIYFNNAMGDNKTKIQTVEQWGSIKWGSMEGAFNGAENLTVPAVDAPDLTKVTSMRFMFQNASVFNQDISSWNTENINNMSAMFSGATAFNQDISKWNTAMVTDMSFMFSFTDAFNQDISKWNTAMVTNMSFMFTSASAFNQDISKWNTAMVMSMSGMFAFASAFNQNIRTSGNSWNTAMVADMSQMFQGATVFNQDISGWNVDAVTAVEKCSDFADSSVLINANWPTFMNAAAACNPSP